ncbi:MAG: hypothetical protein ACP5MG_08390 [Verrucomicrobiia bacterium]|jgi:hypothetical protein
MGLIKRKPSMETITWEIKAGSFNVDANGKILSSTLPSSVPEDVIKKITEGILGYFYGANKIGLFNDEVNISFPTLKIFARKMRGGALIRISPVNPR